MTQREIFFIKIAMYLLLLLTIAGMNAQPAQAQPFSEQRLEFEHLTVEDGLSSLFVWRILQDSRGFLWIATLNGLNRFDGYEFTVFKKDGPGTLSHNDVWALFEDHAGILWVGTYGGGLNRFDTATQTFQHHFHDPQNPNSLGDNSIREIYESPDEPGILWIATYNGGLNRFDTRTETFTCYRHNPNDPNSLAGNRVHAIHEDRAGVLWLGTDRGLSRMNEAEAQDGRSGTITFINYRHNPADPQSLLAEGVHAILEDSEGAFWIGTDDGLSLFDRKTETFTHFRHDPEDPNSLSRGSVRRLFEDKAGNFWIGNIDSGLDMLNRATQDFTRYFDDPDDPHSLSHFNVKDIYQDRSGILWVATFGGGLNKASKKKFGLLRHEPRNPNSIVRNFVSAIYESGNDQQGSLMVGTQGGGLTRINWRAGDEVEYRHYRHDPKNPQSLSGNYISVIRESRQEPGVYWIGANKNGLNRFDSKTGVFMRYRSDPALADSLQINHIREIHESLDEPGILWIGVYFGGLKRFDTRSARLTGIRIREGDISALQQETVISIYASPDLPGVLWVCSIYRIIKLTPYPGIPTKDFGAHSAEKEYIAKEMDSLPLRMETPAGLMIKVPPMALTANDGMVWFNTIDGLTKIDPFTDEILYTIEVADTLAEQGGIKGLLEDDRGKLWISVEQRLCRLDPQTKTFRNYDVSDGLQGNHFFQYAFFKGNSGRMYFGGTDGLNVFHPDSITDNTHIPPVVITDFRVLNESAAIDTTKRKAGFRLSRHIAEADSLVLSYQKNVFSFEFAALDFTAPEKNQYAYKMEGFDQNWIHSGNRRFATYTNLDPGDYVFRVKGSNNDGHWNEKGTSIKVTILPPWWRTWWAYTLYGALFLGLLYGWRRYEKNRQQLKHEAELQKIEAEKLQEMDHLKSGFFANISHEFRTPLTLIMGQIESVMPKLRDAKESSKLAMAMRNAKQLLRLINQLLDLSKIEAGGMQLDARPGNILPLLKNLTQSFESLARKKQIDLIFTCEHDSIIVNFEQEKIEKIMYNLLSNALKFTPDGGTVAVAVASGRDAGEKRSGGEREHFTENTPAAPHPRSPAPMLHISVRDSGIGIPPDRLPHIFDRFYQVDASQTREHEGTGIGLALTKELVELHGGRISVESAAGFGTTFTVQLPIINEQLSIESEQILDDSDRYSVTSEQFSEPSDEHRATSVEQPTTNNKQPATTKQHSEIVLIVEDNADVRAYIRQNLEDGYRIVEAKDGEEGFAKAQEYIPDLIVSDVMMPKVDGYELARQIRSHAVTSHIPIIMLTAKAGEDERLEGLETGVDAYLVKPFSTKELQVRVRKLIEMRKKLREQVQGKPVIRASEVMVTSVDQEFLERLQNLVEEHLQDETFQVDVLCRKIGMSRRQLQRKLNALLDCSPALYIRRIRLERAKQLLEQNAGTVSEIAFDVGYGDVSAFARAFREAFGKPPSDFLKK